MIKASFNIVNWLREFKVAEKDIKDASEIVFEEVSDIIYTNVINYTPVGDPSLWKYPAPPDYKPGTLKASWSLEMKNNIATISNSQPYAERVEYGWSTQAPNGMLRRAIAQYPKILEQSAVRHKL